MEQFSAAWEDIGEEEHLLVGQPGGYFERPYVREGDPHELGLASRVTAKQVREAECPEGEGAVGTLPFRAFGLELSQSD